MPAIVVASLQEPCADKTGNYRPISPLSAGAGSSIAVGRKKLPGWGEAAEAWLPAKHRPCSNRAMSISSLSVRCLRAALSAAMLSVPLCLPAAAQQPPEPVREAVSAFLTQQTAGLPGKVDLQVGEFDAGNRLPPCAELTPFLPPGTRAWGRISVAVRCESPVIWTVYVPAQVAVMSEFLVAAQPLRAGQIVGPADLGRRFGDLASEPLNALTDATQAVGHPVRYAVAAGSTLHANMLRLPPAVRQGQVVKVVGSGTGFTVSNEGRALNAAAEGELVRVRLGNGHVVSGTARAGGLVEMGF
jgi:flagella basal body P-ring formation protein FlgA